MQYLLIICTKDIFSQEIVAGTGGYFSLFEREEEMIGKGETAGYQHFLCSHNVFKSFL